LQHQIRVAEELAMWYADARAKLARDYLERRNGCESTLLGQLASHHKILCLRSLTLAAAQRVALRSAVHLPVLVLCLAGAFPIIGRVIHRRFSRDEHVAIGLATIIASLALGWLITILRELWGGVVEMVRVGNTHMAYRATRIGWRETGWGGVCGDSAAERHLDPRCRPIITAA
jgi:hypothetical protein